MSCKISEQAKRSAVLIRGARVADPRRGFWNECDVLVDNGEVKCMEQNIGLDDALGAVNGNLSEIDAGGLWLWPGLVDLHVHFREPGFTHKETIKSGSEAALNGGYSAVVCEPNTDPPLAGEEVLENIISQAEEETNLRVFFKAAMSEQRKGEQPSNIEALARLEKVVAISDDGDPIIDPALMEEVCRRSAAVGLPICPHCEDSARSDHAMEKGLYPGFDFGVYGTNEANYIRRDAQMAAKWGVPAHFSHVSKKESICVVESIKKSDPSARLTLEVAPHHLLLDVDDELGCERGKVNPPLRSADDREALAQALVQGEIDAIASDHAPHRPEEKRKGASGFIGIETTLSLMLTHFVHKSVISPLDAANLMSTQPAEILGLPGGNIRNGALADFVFIDPYYTWTIKGSELRSRSENTPYEGWKVRGRAVGVMIDGVLAYSRDGFKDRLSA